MTAILVSEELAGMSGAQVHWKLSSTTVDHTALTAAWKKASLPMSLVPSTAEPETVLRRAVSELRKPHLLVRNHKGVFVLSDERVRKEGVEYPQDVSYTPRTTVSMSKTGKVKVEPFDQAVYDTVNDAYQTGLGELSSADFTPWLVRLVAYCAGVSMREGGGIYFIPRAQVPTWRMIKATISSVSEHKLYMIPAMQSDEAVEAILDAIESEAAAEAARLERKLFPNEEGAEPEQLGLRALHSLGEEAKAVARKVGVYEALLGTRLEKFGEQMTKIKRGLTVAALKAEGQRQAAAVTK